MELLINETHLKKLNELKLKQTSNFEFSPKIFLNLKVECPLLHKLNSKVTLKTVISVSPMSMSQIHNKCYIIPANKFKNFIRQDLFIAAKRAFSKRKTGYKIWLHFD